MSGLLHGNRRWPSWVFAYVSGTNLKGVLKAQGYERCCLNCLDVSLPITLFNGSRRIMRACARAYTSAGVHHAAAMLRPCAW